MKQDSSLSTVDEIMTEFAELTGLTQEGKVPRRYLWTDAFAVCNFLELYRQTSDEKYRGLAIRSITHSAVIVRTTHETDGSAASMRGRARCTLRRAV